MNEFYSRLLRVTVTVLLGFMILPVFIQILSRYVPFIPRYIWTEEAARFCFVWMIMVGSMIAVRESAHFEVDLISKWTSTTLNRLLQLGVHVSMMFLALVFVLYGYEFAKLGFEQSSEMIGINMLSIYAAFPLAGGTWFLFLLEQMVRDLKGFRIPAKKESS